MNLQIITWPLKSPTKKIVLSEISGETEISQLLSDLELCTYFKVISPYFKFLENKYKIKFNDIETNKKIFHYPILYDFEKNICILKNNINYSGIKKNTFCLISSCRDRRKNFDLIKECITYGFEYYIIYSKNVLQIQTYLKKHKVPSDKIIKIEADNILDFISEAVLNIDLISEKYSLFIACFSKDINNILRYIKFLRNNGNINITARFICI
jgi:hypothetical protein